MAALDSVLQAIITICILVFSAKILGEIFSWRKIPSVLGELVAGMILGPYALGQVLVINGVQLIEINEIVLAFSGCANDLHFMEFLEIFVSAVLKVCLGSFWEWQGF